MGGKGKPLASVKISQGRDNAKVGRKRGGGGGNGGGGGGGGVRRRGGGAGSSVNQAALTSYANLLEREVSPLWCSTSKNRKSCATRWFVRSFARISHSFAGSTLLRSRTLLVHSFDLIFFYVLSLA